MAPERGRKAIRPLLLLGTFALVLTWSAIRPADRLTWWLEASPALAGAVVLVLTFRRFRFRDLLYTLMWLHALILLVGGHYTYAEVPAFNYSRDALGLSRNHYDRVGHFAQGFVPFMIARELFVRLSVVRRGAWLTFACICVAMAVSAAYEIIEWQAAMIGGASAEAFLAMQGDIWDTQKDMTLALAGALLAHVLLRRRHDRLLRVPARE